MGTQQMAHNEKDATRNDAPNDSEFVHPLPLQKEADNFDKFIAAQLSTDLFPESSGALAGKEIPGIDMIPVYSLYRIGEIFDEGIASGYPKENWKKGVGDKAYQIARAKHAAKHLWKWLNGDRSEAHLAKVAWFCVTQLELERLERDGTK